MMPKCVSAFYKALEKTKRIYDIYRFKTSIINEKDQVIELRAPHPRWEPWYESAYFSLKNLRNGNQQELVFRLEAFKQIGGFLDLSLSSWSDIAFAISCATRAGIFTMKDGCIQMRMSSTNISAKRDKTTYHFKLCAMVGYINWLISHIEETDCGTFPDQTVLIKLAIRHFFHKLISRQAWISWKDVKLIMPLMQERFGIKNTEALGRLIYFNLSFLAEEMRLLIRSCMRLRMDSVT